MEGEVVRKICRLHRNWKFVSRSPHVDIKQDRRHSGAQGTANSRTSFNEVSASRREAKEVAGYHERNEVTHPRRNPHLHQFLNQNIGPDIIEGTPVVDRKSIRPSGSTSFF